jgi:hypothetical protein
MTRKILYAIPMMFLFGACQKTAHSPGTGKTDSTTNLTTDTTPVTSAKKGADFSTNMTYGTWNGDVAALQPFWYYTWGTPMPSPSPQNCEFVSMFWGAANVTSQNIAAVQQLAAQGSVK